VEKSQQDQPFPNELDFAIGDDLPADSAVARLVVSLAAAANDLILVQKLWFSAVEMDMQLSRELDEGESFYMFRLTLSIIWETHLLLQTAQQHDETAAFLDGLSSDAQASLATIEEAVKAMESERYRGVVAATRNVTSHYPKPDATRGGKSLQPTLAGLAAEGARSKIRQTGPTMGEVRFLFADEVLYHMAFKRVAGGPDSYKTFLEKIAIPAAKATIDLCHRAVVEYFASDNRAL